MNTIYILTKISLNTNDSIMATEPPRAFSDKNKALRFIENYMKELNLHSEYRKEDICCPIIYTLSHQETMFQLELHETIIR